MDLGVSIFSVATAYRRSLSVHVGIGVGIGVGYIGVKG